MKKDIKGNIAAFETLGLVDGPGVRFVVFMQGCPLRCAYCHNPEMWNGNEKKIIMTPLELVEKICKYKPYFKDNGGVTISGGEPLLQSEFVAEVFKLCKQQGIHTCLDTSGYGDGYADVLKYCDLVILDVKSVNRNQYERLVGNKMDKFNNFLNFCQNKKTPLWLRQVIVPGLNDNKESVLKLKQFAEKLSFVEKIELLPYHTMAIEKYEKLGLEYRLKDISDMDKKKCKELEKLLN